MEATSLTDLWVRIEFSGATARVDELVTARLEAMSLELSSPFGNVTIDDPSIAATALGISLWEQTINRVVVVTSRAASLIYRVSLSDMDLQELDVLLRVDDDDLRNMSCRPASDGSLLLLYERGLVCLDPDGFVRWHRLHDDISARIVENHGRTVWLETQWPVDLAGRRVGYDLATGEESFK
jgi:hypothetical protein